MKSLFILLLLLSLSIPAFSQQVFLHKKSSGDSLRFRFIMPHKMKLKIFRNNQVIKEYEIEGIKDLEMITELRRVWIYSDKSEMRFYLVDDETLITIPESMVKNEIKSL